MSYKIVYGSMRGKTTVSHRCRRLILTLSFFTMFVFAAYFWVPERLADLQQVLFPTVSVEALVQDLLDGNTLFEAVGAFCQGFLDGN